MAWFGSANAVTKGVLDKKRYQGESPTSLLGGLVPPDASRARSDATADALAAAKRARKRAGAGAGTLLTGQPLGAGINPPGVLTPKSLVGG